MIFLRDFRTSAFFSVNNIYILYPRILQVIHVTEWDRLQESEDTQSQFTEDEEDMITVEAMQILLDKLDVDEDEFEDHEQHVDWMRFDDIIGHYVCYVK